MSGARMAVAQGSGGTEIEIASLARIVCSRMLSVACVALMAFDAGTAGNAFALWRNG